MSNWLEEKIKDTWRWDRLEWPGGLHAGVEGIYRTEERPIYGEQRFIPQWKRHKLHSWQSWFRNTWGRCSSPEIVSFPTLHEAKAWLDEAHLNRPHFAEHQYTPRTI